MITDYSLSNNIQYTLLSKLLTCRYGILDDTGYSGDPLYPSFYRREGGLVPSLAHNGVLTGTWLRNGEECDPSTRPDTAAPDCVFVPDNARSEGVTCSLGNGLGLSQTTRYCNSSETWPAPTKHAVVCGGRAAAEIIAAHPDFRGPSMSPRSAVVPEPEITVTRAPSTRYVLALETSARMAATRHWAWVRKAAHRFIRGSLPVSSSLAVLTFARAAVRLEHAMVAVTSDQVRTVLADTIPGRYHLEDTAVSAASCVDCVVAEAARLYGGRGLELVLVTSTQPRPGQHQRAAELARRHNIRVSLIVLDNNNSSSNNSNSSDNMMFYDTLAEQTRGVSHRVACGEAADAMEVLFSLNSGLEAVLRTGEAGAEAAVVVHSAAVRHQGGATSEGEFVVEGGLGLGTEWAVYTRDAEEHGIKAVTFEDAAGRVYGPFTKLSSALDPFNIKTINYVGEEPPFNDVRLIVLIKL